MLTGSEEIIEDRYSAVSAFSAVKERVFKSEEADPHKQTVGGKGE
jgi:hypothetical protein